MKRGIKLNKKGDILGMPPAVFAVIVLSALIVIFLIVPFGSKVMKLFSPSKTDCINQEEWPKLLSILKKLDEGELDKWETQFFNKNCNIVSFTFSHGLQNHKIKPGSRISLGNEPQLCLCEVKEEACYSSLCYKFKNFEAINSKQFETTDYADQLTIKFNKNNKNLLVDVVGLMKEPEPVAYTFSEDYKLLDPSGLVNKLVVNFGSREISSFIPIVEVKPADQFAPVGVPVVKDFTFFFDVKLARTVKDLPLSAVKDNPQIIDPNTVESAEIQLNIPKQTMNNLPQDLRSHVKIYFFKNGVWKFSNLECSENINNYVCSTLINGFSENFEFTAGLSPITEILSKEDLDNLLKNSNSDVLSLISSVSEKFNVPPGLAIALATQESNLRHYDNKGNVILGDKGNAVGMFQMTRKKFQPNYDCNLDELACNVAAGLDILRDCHNQYGNKETMYLGCPSSTHDKVYAGWDAALRCYNGWPKFYSCSGDPNYVANVNVHYSKLALSYKSKDREYGLT
ncbi:MAG TPA: transglycosylase SLT domain-containing protein [Candidatus Nanoarchaeia archaeon]|nr:transglycosylase SLT domain-containing protein [Candidatus Nanoarchaeia archaeon]